MIDFSFIRHYDDLTMLTKSDFLKIKQLVDESVGKTEKRLKQDIVQFKDDILKEIKDLREEVTVVTGYKDTIEDHETRIEKLENTSI